jgi:hypothetical protein
MYSILCQHFADVEQSVFERDLREKDWVICVEDADGEIQGFSTLQRMTIAHGNSRVHAFFSGDTVLSEAVMGDASWIPVWTRLAFQEAAKLGPEKCYWLLLTATHKTYRILPSCFSEYIPKEGSPSPQVMKDLLGQFVRKKFPQEFNEETGLVVLSKPIPYRNAERVEREADSSEHHMATRFFKQLNPEFLRGDFLCCLTELSPQNMTSLGLRILNSIPSRQTMMAE